MNEAPERLWVFAAEYGRKGFIPMGDTEYIRADLAAERERKLVEALALATSMLPRECPWSDDTGDYREFWAYRRRMANEFRATLKELGYE